MLESQLKKIKDNFSNKQTVVYKKIEPLVGDIVAIALISMQGVAGTSQQEIKFVAELISELENLKVVNFENAPRSLELSSDYGAGYEVRIIPQFKVIKPETSPKPNGQPWSVDLVIELYKEFDHDTRVLLGRVAYEYDGHDSHYTESNIIKAHHRDAGTLQQEGFNPVRISPNQWKTNSVHYKNSLTKYLNKLVTNANRLSVASVENYVIRGGVRDDVSENSLFNNFNIVYAKESGFKLRGVEPIEIVVKNESVRIYYLKNNVKSSRSTNVNINMLSLFEHVSHFHNVQEIIRELEVKYDDESKKLSLLVRVGLVPKRGDGIPVEYQYVSDRSHCRSFERIVAECKRIIAKKNEIIELKKPVV
ncbi:hypothetical protein [Vibrio metschnikovii]|uniref:hypothetical protein n=1 Tax=Vibrio metschnikovii TaxID=28172 RepID=UPI001C302F03|nr:hypothetical protein [Vibrio metschnikovii]